MLDWLERLGRLPAEVWLIPPAVIVAVLLGVGIVRHRARLRRYRAIATLTGLSVKPAIVKASEVRGLYGGRSLVMTTASAPPTWLSWRRTWTMVTVNVANTSRVGLKIRRKDLLDRLLRLDTIKSDDREFDRRYLVLSRDAGAAMRILSDSLVRSSLLQADVNTVRLYNAMLQVFYARDERDPEHARQLFDASARLADAVDAIRYP
jgi:hypothetical protein